MAWVATPPCPFEKRPRQAGQRRSVGSTPSAAARWLLLIHQIPPKPDYLRVKIGRRLQRVGAVAIKNSVYVLPSSPECREDFQWIVREIEESAGEAFVSEASLVGEGLTDAAVRARFDAARNEEYRSILADAKSLMRAARPKSEASGPAREHELAKLERRLASASAIDFFGASEQAAAAAAIESVRAGLRRQGAKRSARDAGRAIVGATWVTRRDVHVDRIASAWLVRRFIDRRPRFRFVETKTYEHRRGELRFDMFEAEYTDVGDACTFETLVSTFIPGDKALREMAKVIHDVDCKDAKFRRDEAPGVARMVEGIVALYARDEDRLEHGGTVFDALYAAFGRKGVR